MNVTGFEEEKRKGAVGENKLMEKGTGRD